MTGLVLDEALEMATAARMAELAQGLGLDLPDALASDLEVLAHLFERVIRPLTDAEAHLEHLRLPRRERGQRDRGPYHVFRGFGGIVRESRDRR